MEFYRAILIHIAIPAAGLLLYWLLCQRMQEAEIESPPTTPLFILFCAYGGWVMIFLTMFFWEWSGMASLGFFGLLLVAPLIMLGLTFYLFRQRKISKYHYVSFLLSIFYICFVAALFGIRIIAYLME